MVDGIVSEEEARGKGTLLEQYGGPRFILAGVGFLSYILMVILNQLLVVFGKASMVIDPAFSSLVLLMIGGYFVSRTLEKKI